MKTAFTLFFASICMLCFAQVTRQGVTTNGNVSNIKTKADKPDYKINWGGIKKQQLTETVSSDFLCFEGAIYTEASHSLPVYSERQKIQSDVSRVKAKLINPVYKGFDGLDISKLEGIENVGTEIDIQANISIERKERYAQVNFIPIRKNPTTGQYEKLVSFDIEVIPTEFAGNIGSPKSYAAHSVLSTGNWYKIAVSKSAIHKIDYTLLQGLGIDPTSIDPRNIRIYGNGGGMLPQANSAFRHDDLAENAIYVSGENDGSFDQNDFILFYGESPNQWSYDPTNCGNYKHSKNLYSDYTYYFINTDVGLGKRIASQSSSSGSSTHTVTKFDDHLFHESDEVNFIKSGKNWWGEVFDLTTYYTFDFNFPNIDVSTPINVKAEVAGRYTTPVGFNLSVNGNTQASISVAAISGSYIDSFVKIGSTCNSVNVGSSNVQIGLSYSKGGLSEAKGWLDYIEVVARRNLTMSGSQMRFRDAQSVGLGNVAQFNIGNASGITVWDVTDPTNVKSQQLQSTGSTATFKMEADELHEYLAFTGGYETPLGIGAVANQDLHGLPQADMFIVCHPNFMSEAQRLADFHRNKDENQLEVVIVEPQQIYNEFSSGAQDVSAIRDFMKMFYDRSTNLDDMPRYLLLFGDPSYDYKNRIESNTNFVPTYESENSISPVNSYSSDDFFGLLDDNEGVWGTGDADALDIGIGRFPVSTVEHATGVVNKILGYEGIGGGLDEVSDHVCSEQGVSIASSDWRNIICFIADDEDNNMHLTQANSMADTVDLNYNSYNIDKIYFDAYPQISTPGGQRYPGATEAINNRVEKGALIINYTGHGGEVGWAHERVLQLSDINGWQNNYRLPAFITATCEFSRYDDPERISAGEYVLLNPNGGGIALFTTTRLVYSQPNFQLNKDFYSFLFEEVNGEIPTMGEVIRKTKVANVPGVNSRNFSLLGDPAQKLAYPVHNVVTTEINNQPVTNQADTLKALNLVTVKGELHHRNGGKLTDFTGTLYPTVFDKATTVTTLGNDQSSNPMNFSLQKNILYKGKVSVTNGDFSFSFVVPKDISYNYGIGRISYYAENGITNANGYYENIIIGGSADDAPNDEQGPQVALYLNDDDFVFGGITNENPLLYAEVSDDNGINTVGNGIGHDITAVLDDNTTNSYVLNEYYEADLDSYQSGKVNYPFSDLSEGRHTLRFKVWDVYNNSSEAYTEFVVAQSADLALEHVLNYPNPFTTHTEFHFEHNHPCDLLNVNIQIFTISGKLVKTLNQTIHSEGFRAEPVAWDGRDDYGQKIGRGVYVYHIKVRTDDGAVADAYERLVILN